MKCHEFCYLVIIGKLFTISLTRRRSNTNFTKLAIDSYTTITHDLVREKKKKKLQHAIDGST